MRAILWYVILFIVVFLCAFWGASCNAQTVNVHLTDGKTQWYEQIPVKHRTADHRWITMVAISALFTAGDIENSLYALHYTNGIEVNPLYGKHPDRLRYYAISIPIFSLAAYESYKFKREDDALKDSNLEGHKYAKWWIPNLVNTASHAIGIAFTISQTKR